MENEVKFYVEKRKNKETGQLIVENVPILLFYSYNGKRLQYYTGLRLAHSDHFDGNTVIKGPKEEVQKINKELTRLEAKVHEIAEKTRVNNEELNNAIFKEKLRGTKKQQSGKKNFLEALEEYYEKSALTKTAETIDGHKSTFRIFSEFSKDKRIRLDFNNIDQDFYDAFVSWCFETKGYKNNNTGKLIKDLKTYLYWATEKGYNMKLDFQKKSFKKLTEEPEIIFLTWEELMKLHSHKFKKEEKVLAEVRDIFCFACFTGLRYSDILPLEKSDIFKDFIRYRVEKTEETNNIPLNPYSSSIIAKYKNLPGDKVLPSYSLNEVNDTLKILFKIVKLNRKVRQTHFQGKKAIVTIQPLCDAITFHISKKTFMTNFLAKGGSLLTAMAITGNKDFKTARRYYKVVDSLKADEMKKVFG
jgi:integrase